jgi:hypothetical protein
MPSFSAQDLETLSKTAEVEVEPIRSNGSAARRKIIWIVVDSGQAYIRSVRGESGAWFKVVRRSGSAVIHAGSTAWPVTLTVVTDQAEIARVSDALRAKYEARWKGPTASMLRDNVLSSTLRVVPRE